MYAQAKTVIMARPEKTINRSLWNRFAISKFFITLFSSLSLHHPGKFGVQGVCPFHGKDVPTVIAAGLPGSNDLMRGVDLVEHVTDRYLFVSVLALDIFNGRIEDAVDPHSFLSSLIFEMDGQIAGGMAFFDEPAEDDPRSPFLSHQNTFDSLALRLIRPLVDVKRLDPPDRGHLLWRVVENYDVKIVKGSAFEFPLVDMNRPVTETALMGTEISEGYMSLADDLAVAIFKKESFDPPFLRCIC
jgi:hypothetical protein